MTPQELSAKTGEVIGEVVRSKDKVLPLLRDLPALFRM